MGRERVGYCPRRRIRVELQWVSLTTPSDDFPFQAGELTVFFVIYDPPHRRGMLA